MEMTSITTKEDWEKFNQEIAEENNRIQILEDAIWIVVHAMWQIEEESETTENWYLPYLKLRNTFQHLCASKYLGESEAAVEAAGE